MRTNQIYVGIKGFVLALNSADGQVLWKTDVGGSSYVTIVDDGPCIYALSYGEAYCLDAQTGSILWHNPLKGCGYGLGSITVPGRPVTQVGAIAQIIADEQQRAAASNSNTTNHAG